MERLRHSELDSIRQFLEETAVPCDLSTFGSLVLPAVQKLVPSVVVCYAQIDPARQKMVRQETFPLIAGSMERELFDLHMGDHPIFQRWAQTGDTSAARTSDFLSVRQWHEFSLYQTVYKRLGCEDSLAIGLPAPVGLVATICSERDTPFNARELLLMNIARPHLVQAYRNAELVSLLGSATDRDGMQTMVIDSRGRPLLAPEATWQLLEKYFPDGRAPEWSLPETVSNWLSGQLSRLRRDCEVPSAGSPLVIQKEDGRTLTLRMLPGGLTGEQALLVFQERLPSALETISSELGLTPREEEVLREAMRGLGSAEIAETLCISRRTVEKHLENIYGKLGVDSRGAAVAKALFP